MADREIVNMLLGQGLFDEAMAHLLRASRDWSEAIGMLGKIRRCLPIDGVGFDGLT
jgi:hypothetical protein